MIMRLTTIAAALLSVIYAAGVVWRVERALDVSYKWLLTGILFFLSAEILDLSALESFRSVSELLVAAFRMCFAVCFLVAILLMRGIVRSLDGEKRGSPGTARR